jgi:two-component system sensor histidine kinase DegS
MSFSPMDAPTEEQTNKVLDDLLSESRNMSGRIAEQLKEIDITIRQTQAEVDRLSQREAQSSGRLRDMEMNMEAYPLGDIKSIYNQSHDNQVRLMKFRSDLENLEGKRETLKGIHSIMARLTQTLSSRPRLSDQGPTSRIRGVDKSVDATELISKIIKAQEDERLRVSRQMHDGPAQAMSNLVLRAEICERWMENDMSRAKAELSGLKSMVNDTLQETRRFIFDLRPMILDDLGLIPTLRRYIKDFKDKTRIEVHLDMSGPELRLPNHIEVAAFRIIQEALSNVAKHANATQVNIRLEIAEKRLSMIIEDDGNGFDVSILSDEKKMEQALGIASMGQRMEMLNGTLDLASTPGRGTRIAAYIPL